MTTRMLLALLLGLAAGSELSAQTWELQSPLPTGASLQDVVFLDEETALVCGSDGLILRTSNNGQSWTPVRAGQPQEWGLQFSFGDPEHGWVGGTGGLLLETADGGLTWKP